MTEQKERRKYKRVNTEVHVGIQKYDEQNKDIKTGDGMSRNLSTGGILIRHEKPLEVPSYIIVSFTLPDLHEKMDFIGKVVRIEELTSGSYEVGVMFMKMIIGEFNELNKFVKRELGR